MATKKYSQRVFSQNRQHIVKHIDYSAPINDDVHSIPPTVQQSGYILIHFLLFYFYIVPESASVHLADNYLLIY